MRMAFLSIHSSPLGKAGSKDTGGMSIYLLGLSAALGAAGHRVDLFTRAASAEQEGVQNLFSNVRLIALNDGKGPLDKGEIYPHCPLIAATIERFCRHEQSRYDLIFSHYWLSGCVGMILKEQWQIPHLIMFHTLGRAKNESCRKENEPLLRIAEEEKLAQSCDLLVTAAEMEKERIINYYGLPPAKIAVIPCGIDRSLFRPIDRQAAKEKLDLGGKKMILAVGRIEPVKGLENLINAASLLPPEDDIKIFIIGGDHQSRRYIADLKETAAAFGIADRLEFTGMIEHKKLPLYYNAAHLTVVVSFYESFGLTALESLACGTRIVGAPLGIIPELIQQGIDGRFGYLINNRSPASWAAKIRKTLLEPEKINHTDIDQLLAPYNWPDAAARLTGLKANFN